MKTFLIAVVVTLSGCVLVVPPADTANKIDTRAARYLQILEQPYNNTMAQVALPTSEECAFLVSTSPQIENTRKACSESSSSSILPYQSVLRLKPKGTIVVLEADSDRTCNLAVPRADKVLGPFDLVSGCALKNSAWGK